MEADDTQRLRELRQVVYREFVEQGRPPTAAEAARRLRLGVEEVLAGWGRLHDDHVLVLDEDRVAIRMAHPFSARQMHFVVASAEQKWWGGCAWRGSSTRLPDDVRRAHDAASPRIIPAIGRRLARLAPTPVPMLNPMTTVRFVGTRSAAASKTKGASANSASAEGLPVEERYPR